MSVPNKSLVTQPSGKAPVTSKNISNPIGLLMFLSKPTKEAWYVINAPRVLYVIATESRMASRASVHIRRLDNIHPLRDDSIQPLWAEDIPPAADFIHGYAVI